MSATPLSIGQKVRHIARHSEHDNWQGFVVRIETIETDEGKTTTYCVRWINPNGNPSDGTTGHARFELEPA